MLSSLSILILLPLLLANLAFLSRKYQRYHFLISLKIIASALMISIFLPISSKIYQIDFGIIQLKFMSDIYSYLFGILVCAVWLITVLYSYSYNKLTLDRNKIIKFHRYLNLTIFSVFGNGYCGDLKTLFIFYFLMIIFSAPLIISKPAKSSIKAYLLYLKTHLATSLLLFLPAIIILKFCDIDLDFAKKTYQPLQQHPTLAGFIIALFIFGIAKNCVLPFHQWITRTTIAPTPVSALFHSVAAVKSGSIAMVKIIVYTFGLEFTRSLTNNFFTGGWIFYLCGITAIYSAYRAYRTTKIKSRFAYSTISQLSYILSSLLIANKTAIIGAMLHIISHSLCKIALFFIAGIFSTIYHTHNTKEAGKIAPNIKFWIGCLTFCGASIIGLPFLPGSFGKDYMLVSEFNSHHYSALIFLIAGSIINILYIYPIFKAGFFNEKNPRITKKYIPLPMRMAIIIAISLSIALSFYIQNFINFFSNNFIE